MEEKLKAKVVDGLFWKFFERGFLQGLTFLIQIILARMLLPSDYGILVLVLVVVNVVQSIINSGLATALIQKKDSDEIDQNTVFFSSLLISILLYILFFFISPLLVVAFDISEYPAYFRVVSISIIFDSLYLVHSSILTKSMRFKKHFFIYLASTIAYGLASVILANLNFGIWSLIIGTVVQKFTLLISFWIFIRWRPKRLFSFSRLLALSKFGWKLSLAWIIGTAQLEVSSLIIGVSFGKPILGNYDKSKTLPSAVDKVFNDTFPIVLFPAFASIQEDKILISRYLSNTTRIISFFIFPALFGISALSGPIILVLFGENWISSISMMEIYVFTIMFSTISNLTVQAFNSIGKSSVFLKIELLRRTASILAVLIAAFFNIYVLLWVLVVVNSLSYFLVMYYSHKFFGESTIRQAINLLKPLLASALMFVSVKVSIFYIGNGILQLITGFFVGVVTYFLFSLILNKKSIDLIKTQILSLSRGKNG